LGWGSAPDRSAGLLLARIRRSLTKSESIAPEPDGARGDEQDLAFAQSKVGESFDHFGLTRKREATVFAGEHTGSDFDDNAFGGGDRFVTGGFGCHGRSVHGR